jgi:hypothetical protein
LDDRIRVRAVFREDGTLCKVARFDSRGFVLKEAFIGIDPNGAVMPEGEMVPRHPHYLRALKRGELQLAVDES